MGQIMHYLVYFQCILANEMLYYNVLKLSWLSHETW
jgi:hypothetical protein